MHWKNIFPLISFPKTRLYENLILTKQPKLYISEIFFHCYLGYWTEWQPWTGCQFVNFPACIGRKFRRRECLNRTHIGYDNIEYICQNGKPIQGSSHKDYTLSKKLQFPFFLRYRNYQWSTKIFFVTNDTTFYVGVFPIFEAIFG